MHTKIWYNSCICLLKPHLFFFVFIAIRTSPELQNLLLLCYFWNFELQSWGFGLYADVVYTEAFTMLVIKL